MLGPIQRSMVFGLQAAGCIYLGFWAFIGFAIIWAGFLFRLDAAIGTVSDPSLVPLPQRIPTL